MMLGGVEFKRGGMDRIRMSSGNINVPRTQHASDCAVLQNNTSARLLTRPDNPHRLFLGREFGVALVSKIFL